MENQNQNSSSGQQTINIQIPSADNIANRRTLIPASFALAIIFFFFTFCEFKCAGQKIGSVTGVDLVTGTELKDRDMFSGRKTEGKKVPANIWAVFAFGAAIVGLGTFLIKEKREALIGTGAGAIGAGSLIILQLVIKSTISEQGQGQAEANMQFPYWGALFALGVAGIISYLRMQRTDSVVVSVSPPTDTAVTTTTENISQAQTPVVTIPQTNSIDTIEWVRENKKVVIGILIVAAAGFGVYKFFLHHDPVKDGQSAAIAYCDCGKEQTEQFIKIGRDFLANFESYQFKSKQIVQTTLDSLLKPAKEATLKCREKAQARHTKHKERYITTKELIEKFDYSFNAQQGLCTDEKQTVLNDINLQFQNKYNSITDMEVPNPSSNGLPHTSNKHFSGNVGKLDALYELIWNSDGTIDGTYYYPKRPDIKYTLKGKDLGNGKITLTEYTGTEVSANCNLSLQNNCYIGEMNNTDGRMLKITMCPNEVTSTGYVQTKKGSTLRLRNGPSEAATIITNIPNGAAVIILEYNDHFDEIDGEKGRWCKINYNGTIGWAWGNFITSK